MHAFVYAAAKFHRTGCQVLAKVLRRDALPHLTTAQQHLPWQLGRMLRSTNPILNSEVCNRVSLDYFVCDGSYSQIHANTSNASICAQQSLSCSQSCQETEAMTQLHFLLIVLQQILYIYNEAIKGPM